MESNQRIPLPGVIILGYIGLLVANVAALLVWPFSRLLLWLLILSTGAFFLFALAVLLLATRVLVRATWARLSAAAHGFRNQQIAREHRADYGDPRMWDPWLDGV